MQRLLSDAQKLTGVKYDISNLSDVYEAIHVIQTELGITGTTAKEASSTISGSLSAMKAAWSNLITGIANDNADFGLLVDNFANSVGVAASNIVPRIGVALNGTMRLVETMFPIIMKEIPTVINEWLPTILNSAINIIKTLAKGIQENLPVITQGAGDTMFAFIDGIIDLIPILLTTAVSLVTNLGQYITDNPDKVVESAGELIANLAIGLVTAIPQLLVTAIEIIGSLGSYLYENMDEILTAGLDLGIKLVEGLWAGIQSVWGSFKENFGGLLDGLVAGFNNFTMGGSDALIGFSPMGFKAGGLDYVPFNGYLAELHRGEMVLTSAEADDYRRGNHGASGVTVNQYIYSEAKSAADLMEEAVYQQEKAVLLGV